MTLLSKRDCIYFYLLAISENMKSPDLNFPTCPIRNVLGRLADKWSVLILITLHSKGKMRYTEFHIRC